MKIAPLQAAAVALRDGANCRYCDTPLMYGGYVIRDATIDHLIPRVRGGSHNAENLGLCCRSCNSRKGKKTEFEFICLQMEIEVGWYARLNPEFDEWWDPVTPDEGVDGEPDYRIETLAWEADCP